MSNLSNAAAVLVLGLAACGAPDRPATASSTSAARIDNDACLEAAWQLVDGDHLREAAEAAGACVARAPADPNAHDTEGELWLLAGDLDRAERSFRAALAHDPRFATAHHGLAMIRFDRGDDDGGLAALRDGVAISSSPDPTYALTRLLESVAWAHLLAGRLDDALEAIAASVDAQGLDDAEATAVTHVGRARLFLYTGATDRALTETAAARVAAPQSFAANAARAVEISTLARAGKIDAATTALAVFAAEFGADHPLATTPAFELAIARADLDAAATALAVIATGDPYAAEQAAFVLARALRAAGRDADARPLLDRLTARHLRSVLSAHTRRAALALR